MNPLLLRLTLVLACLVFGAWFGEPAGLAEESPSRTGPNVQVTLATWLSHGETAWSHNASALNFRLGNPTSEITYKDVGTNVVELRGRVTFARRWFLNVEGGFGAIGGGRVTDDDYVSAAGAAAARSPVEGAQRISRTFSDMDGNALWYVSADLGYRLVDFPDRKGSLGLFLGYQYRQETQVGFGVTQVECTAVGVCSRPGTVTASGQPAITNEARWHSLRLGLEGEYRVARRLGIGGAVAFIPFTWLDNDDVHHLRTDLRQDSSFSMTGSGIGVNAQGAVSYQVLERLVFDVGYRFWWLRVRDGDWQSHPLSGPSIVAPLSSFESTRQGVTLGLRYSF